MNGMQRKNLFAKTIQSIQFCQKTFCNKYRLQAINQSVKVWLKSVKEKLKSDFTFYKYLYLKHEQENFHGIDPTHGYFYFRNNSRAVGMDEQCH